MGIIFSKITTLNAAIKKLVTNSETAPNPEEFEAVFLQ
jgi:hypothetical protein